MIIAMSGYAKSGKDTAANIIVENYPNFKVKKFSGKLKEIASILTGIPTQMFEHQSFKEQQLYGWGMTGREFLQKLGTDAIRDGLHSNAWVMSLFCEYHNNDNWIITDCRFPNEYEYVKLFGGKVIRIVRNGIYAVNSHPSEVALDGFDFDYVLENNYGLDELHSNIFEMMNKIL